MPPLTKADKATLDAIIERGLRARDSEMMRLALDKGADPDLFVRKAEKQRVPLWLYEKALERGANADLMLYSGIGQREKGIVELAVKQGKATLDDAQRPNRVTRTEILSDWAYRHYNPDIFKFLVEQGMDVDMPGAGGDTPLLKAVADAQVGRIDEILALGADPLKKNAAGESALARVQSMQTGVSTYFGENRNRLLRDMLKSLPNVPLPNATSAPENARKDFNDVATRGKIGVKKPLTVRRSKPEEGGGFNP